MGMGMVRLGLKNLLRSPIRLAAVVLLIALPLFLLLFVQSIGRAVEEHTRLLKQNVSNTLQIRAKGSLGHVNMPGLDRLLPPDSLTKVGAVEHLKRVEPYMLAMQPLDGPNFALHVGLNPGDHKRLESHGEAGNPKIVAGRDLTPDDVGKDVAIMGQRYAAWAGITPEQVIDGTATFTIDPARSGPMIYPLRRPPRHVKIVGLFASGYIFGDTQLFTSLETFNSIYAPPPSRPSWLFVTVDSSDNLPQVEEAIREALGDGVDVIADKTVARFEKATTEAITRSSAGVTAIGLALMVVVIFFVMLMVVRERAREIATLKAMGAPSGSMILQLLTEALGFSAIGSLVGMGLFLLMSGAVGERLFALGLAPSLPQQDRETLFAVLDISYHLDLATIALALIIVVAVAVIGSTYGLWQVTRLSPMEAMKVE